MSKKTIQIIEKIFEAFLFNSRFVALLAVLGSLMASVVLFVKSSVEIWHGIELFTSKMISKTHVEDHASNELMKILVSAVDEYLFATVLFIFSMGIYELFIRKKALSNQSSDSRPSWMKINSIEDLKSMLGKVIMMVLVVSFFKYSLDNKYDTVLDLLYFGLGILFVSLALYLSHSLHGNKNRHD